jgi:hypothetical protein
MGSEDEGTVRCKDKHGRRESRAPIFRSVF